MAANNAMREFVTRQMKNSGPNGTMEDIKHQILIEKRSGRPIIRPINMNDFTIALEKSKPADRNALIYEQQSLLRLKEKMKKAKREVNEALGPD